MTDEEIAVKFTEHQNEIGSLKHRMLQCEDSQKTINDLLLSVQKLALNMEYMLSEQKEQGQRLEKLENTPLEDYVHYKRLIIGCIITGVIGILIGIVFSNI